MPDDDVQQPSEYEINGDFANHASAEELSPSLVRSSSIPEPVTPVVADGPEQPDKGSVLPFPIVGIGGSAGGVEAYIELFKHLPVNTGMAFVVIPHLAADQKSHLPDIIGRCTTMPVTAIETGLRPQPD